MLSLFSRTAASNSGIRVFINYEEISTSSYYLLWISIRQQPTQKKLLFYSTRTYSCYKNPPTFKEIPEEIPL